MWSVALKAGPYVLVLLLGCFAGYRFELPAVQAAKLQLAAQQTTDAQAIAAADAQAAAYKSQVDALSSQVEASRETARQARQQGAAAERASNAKDAAQPGQDAPVAPDLQQVHDWLLAGQKAGVK